MREIFTNRKAHLGLHESKMLSLKFVKEQKGQKCP